MPWTARGQYCMYCTSCVPMGNLSRHLDTCVRFKGRFFHRKALELEQKHTANYTKKYASAGFEVKEILGQCVGEQLTIVAND